MNGVGLENVVGAILDVVAAQRLFDRENTGKFVDIDFHIAKRFFNQVLVGVRDQRQGLGRVLDFFLGQKRLVRIDQGHGILAGNVCRQNNRELIPGYALLEPDLFDQTARDSGTHRLSVEAVLHFHVIGINRLAGDFSNSLFPV